MAPTCRRADMPELSLLLCLRQASSKELLSRLGRIESTLDGRIDFEMILIGYGPPDDSGLAFRRATDEFPRCRTVMHTRPCPSAEALGYGVRIAGAPWVGLLPTIHEPTQNEADQVADMLALARRAGGALTCVHAGPESPVLFSAAAFAGLPRVRAMLTWLPELFEWTGQPCWRHPGNQESGSAGFTRRLLRRLWVASCCLWATRSGLKAAGTNA